MSETELPEHVKYIVYKKPKESSQQAYKYYGITCAKCGQNVDLLYKYSDGYRYTCTACRAGRTTHDFIGKAVTLFGDRFTYEKVEYVHTRIKVTITCKTHGDFLASPSQHLRKHGAGGCKLCNSERQAEIRKHSEETWRKMLAAKYEHITLDNVTSLGARSKAVFTCNEHGSFTAALKNIGARKYLCPTCAGLATSWDVRATRTDRPALVYFVYFTALQLWKIGVTYRSISDRLASIKEPYEIVWSLDCRTEKDAYAIEAELLTQYHTLRSPYIPEQMRKHGGTELLLLPISLDAAHRVTAELNIELDNAYSC